MLPRYLPSVRASAVSSLRCLLVPKSEALENQRIIDLELRQNNLQAAMKAANALIRAAPNNPESHLLRATVSMRGGDFDQRLEHVVASMKNSHTYALQPQL